MFSNDYRGGVLVSSCGGGSNTTTTTTTEVVSTTPSLTDEFSLTLFNTDISGLLFTTGLSGIDSNGLPQSGFLTITNLDEELFNGVLTVPQEVRLKVADNILTVKNFYDEYRNLLAVELDGELCNNISPDSFPLSVKIGDIQLLSVVSCDEYSIVRTLSVVETSSELADVVFTYTFISNVNFVMTEQEQRFTINATGDIIEYNLTVFYPDTNYTITANSID